MANLIMKDQAKTTWPEETTSMVQIESAVKKVVILSAMFSVSALALAIVLTSGVNASVANADQPDFMISPDFADYMHRYGNGMVFSDMDTQ